MPFFPTPLYIKYLNKDLKKGYIVSAPIIRSKYSCQNSVVYFYKIEKGITFILTKFVYLL